MNGWSPKNYVASGLAAFGASTASTPITRDFPLSAGGANQGLVIAILASGVAGTCTATLQTGLDTTYVAVKNVVLADGYNYIKLNSVTDTALLPLLSKGRVALVTGSSSGCTIEEVQVLQEQ